MVKVVIIGRGEPTPRQVSLLAKALGTEPSEVEFVERIEQLNNAQQVVETLARTGATAVFSFVAHPTVVSALQQARKKVSFDYFVPQTEAVHTATVGTIEEAKQLCQQHGADIVNAKVLPDGSVSVRCTRTQGLMRNPVLRIEYEELITD